MNTVNNEVCEFDSTPTTEKFFKICQPCDENYEESCPSKCKMFYMISILNQ